ncbi:MAG: L,D-transpeptidase family protein [Ferruginibacter sp.]
MTKTIITLGIFFTLFTACNSNGSNGSSSSKNGKNDNNDTTEKKISKRDISINATNAYNDIFFDSMVLVKYFADNKTDADIIRRMTSLYNSRNYQFAWFTKNGLSEHARGFWNMHNYQTTYGSDSSLKDKNLQKLMDGYSQEEDSFTVSSSDKNIVNTELKLTEHFIMYTLNNVEEGYVKRKEMERFIPRKKEDALALADSLLSKKHKDNKYYEDVNNSYKALKLKLEGYLAIAKQGGWPLITAKAAKLKKGSSGTDVALLKRRLALTGDMAADTTPVFNEALEAGIKSFQSRYGYTPTGIITDGLLKDINVPVENRIKLLLLNMGRMQWMITEPKGQLILVNIPEFILHVKDGTSKVFDMPVVVGKDGHNTMMFTGNLNQIVFSPYWNVPSSIVKKEILPAMNRNGNYLASHNMEVTGNEGGLPVIRQLPGGDNSLGKVKFLFPNSFNIYFHDTPAKTLFEKDKRAFSHGCIRLSDPVKMANYLLEGQPEWPAEKIDSAMNSGKEKYVKLKKPVPVLITYYTAWVDDNGALHFADDIYGHDKVAINKMFIN